MGRNFSALVGLTLLTVGCGGGGGTDVSSSSTVVPPSSSPNVLACERQVQYFESLAVVRTGVWSGAVCTWNISLTLNNDPNPLNSCRITGSISHQPIVSNPSENLLCDVKDDVPLFLTQSVAPLSLSGPMVLPTLVFIELVADFPTNDGTSGIAYPINRAATVLVDEAFNFSIDGRVLTP